MCGSKPIGVNSGSASTHIIYSIYGLYLLTNSLLQQLHASITFRYTALYGLLQSRFFFFFFFWTKPDEVFHIFMGMFVQTLHALPDIFGVGQEVLLPGYWTTGFWTAGAVHSQDLFSLWEDKNSVCDDKPEWHLTPWNATRLYFIDFINHWMYHGPFVRVQASLYFLMKWLFKYARLWSYHSFPCVPCRSSTKQH